MNPPPPPPFDYLRHVSFFSHSLASLPSKYTGLDTNRLTLVHFCVHSLKMLNMLEYVLDKPAEGEEAGGVSRRKGIIAWVLNLLSLDPPTSIDANENARATATFRGGTFSGRPFQTFSAATTIPRPRFNRYDFGHIAMTYTALLTLHQLSTPTSHVSAILKSHSSPILNSLRPLQQPNGSFTACTNGCGSESDMRFTFCAVAICYLLGNNTFSSIDKDKVVGFIKACRSYEGGVGLVVGGEAHGGSTLCAVASLKLMGILDEVVDEKWRGELINWCVMKQISGMQGRTNKVEDSCYSFWVGGTLKLLGGGVEKLLDKEKLDGYLMRAQHKKFGGFSKAIGDSPDVLHSFYSLAWLSVGKGEGEEGERGKLGNVDVALGCGGEVAKMFHFE